MPRRSGHGVTVLCASTRVSLPTIALLFCLVIAPFRDIAQGQNTPPFGWLDSATASVSGKSTGSSTITQNSTLLVIGWAADQQDGAPVTQVQVQIDGATVGFATLGGSRPDVATAFSNPAFTNSGWSFLYNIGTLAVGTHSVSAIAFDSSSASTVLSGSKTITVAANTPPFGWLDAATGSVSGKSTGSSSLTQNSTLLVIGWAADQQDGAPVTQVQVQIDGATVGAATLGGSRPDVAAAFADVGFTNSGFSFSYNIGTLAVGTHTVRAVAFDSSNASTVLSGSKTITVAANTPPFGWLDAATDSISGKSTGSSTLTQNSTLLVIGWAADQQDGAPVTQVQVQIDGAPVGTATLGGSRSDVASAYGTSAFTNSGWSFLYNIGTLAIGTHTVSAIAFDSSNASTVLSGSKTITVAANTPPFGWVDSAKDSITGSTTLSENGTLVVSGWAADQQDGAPVTKVNILIDNVNVGAATLGGSRSDVATAYGNAAFTNSGWTFSYSVATLGVGPHVVTATAVDSQGATTTLKENNPLVYVAAPSVAVTVPGPVIYAGGNSETVTISVANDLPGDVLTPTLTMADGSACTPTVCGTISGVSGTSPNYTATYTPPTSLSADTFITLTVTSSLPNSFAGTTGAAVRPAGERVVRVIGVPPSIPAGIPPITGNVTVYNDPGAPGPGATLSLLGSGFACTGPCGTLTIGGTTFGTTTTGTTGIPFTRIAYTYTPPATVPPVPYDRPMILAVSKADNSKTATDNFVLGGGGLLDNNSRLNSALTGSGPLLLGANLAPDTGVNKRMIFTLTANGANCQPGCGTLGAPTYTWNAPTGSPNSTTVSATIAYTPPATVPSAPANTPTLTVTSLDVVNGSLQSDSITFQIQDGSCGTGNNGLLNGQYAFLLQGGGAGQGYTAAVGSFTADGNGNITGGTQDVNRTNGPATGVSILSTGSSYSVGADGRGCLTLANSNGGVASFRIALGTISSGVATQGNIIRFDDVTGNTQRTEGVLLKQSSSITSGTITGPYAIGYHGITNSGLPMAMAGVMSSNGAGVLSSFDLDVGISGGGSTTTQDTSGSGTYGTPDATTGRTTGTFTNVSGTVNNVVYVIDSTRFLYMSTDPLGANTPILSGQGRQQTGGPFAPTALDNNGYAFYFVGVDPASGGSAVIIGQAQVASNGSATVTQDQDVAGTINGNNGGLEQTFSSIFSVASNGRTTFSTGGVMYLVDANSAFMLGPDGSFGFGERQTGTFSAASLSGAFFVGSQAGSTGSAFEGASATFDGISALSVSDDTSGFNHLSPNQAISLGYSVNPTIGQLTITEQNVTSLLGYVISPSKVIFMSDNGGSQSTKVYIGQK